MLPKEESLKEISIFLYMLLSKGLIVRNCPQYSCFRYSAYASFGTISVHFFVLAPKSLAEGGVVPKQVINESESQANAELPIEVTLFPIVADFRL